MTAACTQKSFASLSIGDTQMNEKIMIVDDEPGILALLEVILKRKGFNVVTADGAYRALRMIEREKPDLFILDVMMPGISGLELCKQLRSRPDTAHIPILLLSGWSDSEATQRGLTIGADDYLSKTSSHTLIVSRVQALLSQTRQELRSAI